MCPELLGYHGSRDLGMSSRACTFGDRAAMMAFGLSLAQCCRVWISRWMQVGIWELGLRWHEGGKLAGSPAVLDGVLVGRCGPELEVGLCSSAVQHQGRSLPLRSCSQWHGLLQPHSHTFFLFQLKDNKVFDVPVAVIAGNRPNYLYR